MLELGIVVVLSACGLVLANISEQMQVVFKLEGFFTNRVAVGYNNALKIMLLNRFGAALFVISISYGIEADLGTELVVNAGLLATALLIILTGLVSRLIFVKYVGNDQSGGYFFPQINAAFVSVCVIAYMLNTLALIAPFWLAATYFENRLLIANSGFLLNSIFTAINVFWIESKLAIAIDQQSDDVLSVGFGICIARLLAYLLTGFALAAIY